MKELLSMIEALIRGEYDEDMKYERMIGMTGNLLAASEVAEEELRAVDEEFAKALIDGIYDLDDMEEFDGGSPQTIARYKQVVAQIYGRAMDILKEKGIQLPAFERCRQLPYRTPCPVYGEWIGRSLCQGTKRAANDPKEDGMIEWELRDRGMETTLTPAQRETCRKCTNTEKMFPNW